MRFILKKKRLMLVVALVGIVLLVGFTIVYRHESSSQKSGTPKTDISWADAEVLINTCKIQEIDYGGGLTPDGGGAPDEDYAYLVLKDGKRRTVKVDAAFDLNAARKKCQFYVSMP